MAKHQTVDFSIGPSAITSYRRLAYTPWHAIAELVDNATQSYFNNRDVLDKVFESKNEKFEVSIFYDRDQTLRIVDNAMGMELDELEKSLKVAVPPKINTGRSRYGMGMKTSSCWLGNKWSIRTKKLGSTVEYSVDVNVDDVALGKTSLPIRMAENKSEGDHYTIIEINDHNRRFEGRTQGKIKDFLRSIYRIDISKELMVLKWNEDTLRWHGFDEQILTAQDGKKYKRDFAFKVDGKEVKGWVGVLESGGRDKAGFSILYCNRVIKGWPDAWRPSSIFGQLQGSNDLVNQRLIGEVHLDGFEVSHTKDDIVWIGDQEEKVEEELKKKCADYIERAKSYRKRKEGGGSAGPSDKDIDIAVDELNKELLSQEMLDHIKLEEVPPVELLEETASKIISAVTPNEPRFSATIDDTLNIKIYLVNLSPNDPYVTHDCPSDIVQVIINIAHPYFEQLAGPEDVLNYFRHCVYDAISEWKASKKQSPIDPHTVKKIKDGLLRVKFEMEQHRK